MTRRSVVPALIALVALGVVAYRLLTLGSDPATAELLHREALALERDGRTEDAIVRLRAAVAHDPESVAISRDYQNLMRRAGRLEEVRSEYRKRLANFPRSAAAHYLAARLEEGEALEQGLRGALAMDPTCVWAHRALGVYYGESGRVDSGIEHLRQATTCPGAQLEDAAGLIHLLYQRGRHEEIDTIVADWPQQRPSFCGPDDPLVSIGLGRGPNDVDAQLIVALIPDAPLLYEIRFVRGDRSHRIITVRRKGERYAVDWTRTWLPFGRAALDEPRDSWDKAERPSFTEVHAAAVARMNSDEK